MVLLASEEHLCAPRSVPWFPTLPIVPDLQPETGSRSLYHIVVKWEVLKETQLAVHQICPWRVRESTRKLACVVAFEVGIYKPAQVSRSE